LLLAPAAHAAHALRKDANKTVSLTHGIKKPIQTCLPRPALAETLAQLPRRQHGGKAAHNVGRRAEAQTPALTISSAQLDALSSDPTGAAASDTIFIKTFVVLQGKEYRFIKCVVFVLILDVFAHSFKKISH
jgi:hypothetical protein